MPATAPDDHEIGAHRGVRVAQPANLGVAEVRFAAAETKVARW